MTVRDDPPRSRQLPDIPGVEVLCGTFRDHAFPRHCHDGLMIALIDGGAQRVASAGGQLVATPGQIVAMPAGVVHAVSAIDAEGWRYRVLTIPERLLQQVSERPLAGFASAPVISDRALAAALAATHEALTDRVTSLSFEIRLLDVLAHFLARHARPCPTIVRSGREPEAVRRALEYLGDCPERAVSLTELATAAGLDAYRLVRAFTRELGLPPHAWHLQYRLRTAQSRLACGEAVAAVALALGFADQAHFTRAFRRLTGVTPGRYRADHGHPRTRRRR
ncbi:AraC family transcriptional regulator [Marichromatium gracile]|uniref:helix-turn-helix domain-containing protein n=1 Tax=Marichromatium gracile TaxID=1048 RepID=UPI001F22D0CB|nr:AraC family transcriptional regulator [Marichromatium gracile]MCF1182317.1 AraC family transcriptional regulator [Marichromatium gracile]